MEMEFSIFLEMVKDTCSGYGWCVGVVWVWGKGEWKGAKVLDNGWWVVVGSARGL
jgi:hypothetical protein